MTQENAFTMIPQKQGRMKYLLITMGAPFLISYLLLFLTKQEILPAGRLLSMVYMYLPILLMCVMGYFLIISRNHQLDVTEYSITETDWLRKKVRTIQAAQIHSVRRNFLREIILLDENGKRILCVEANMTNFDQFNQWLERHIN